MLRIRPVGASLLIIGFCALLAQPASAIDDNAWKDLCRDVQTRQLELGELIREANRKGICTDYASVSHHVISAFQLAAKHDRENVERVQRIFQTFSYYSKTDPAEANRLALNELKACRDVADRAIAELRQQLGGTIVLNAPPDLSHGKMKLDGGYYRVDGQTVFPSSLVWMPKDDGYMQAFGRLGEAYYTLGDLSESRTVNVGSLRGDLESLQNQCDLNAAPLVFFLGHAPAGWMKRQHPEIMQGARHFTRYDIDNPLIRDWIKTLCAGRLPQMSRACGDRPRVHLLANEPHFSTRKGGWLADNGVSVHTMQKYRDWIAAKHKSVESLNAVYGTSYERLDQVSVDLPIDPALRGGPVWYDWCRFNMDRVNDWFAFLKQQTQAIDGVAAPVTIKMLGFTLSRNQRDGGMDMEYLTKLQDIPGADLRVVPRDAIFYGKHEEGLDPETGWTSRYAYDWVEQSMYLDFTKSLCPDRLFYDSEWHGFGAVSWRHFELDRDYVRSALWMAFTHGMGAIKPWLWGREADGSLRASADHIGELATQPIAVDAFGRTLKELNAHADQVVSAVPAQRLFSIYYCEEAAIQDADYTGSFKEIYEALKLLNLPVGFTTPSEIGGIDAQKQILIVPPTPFIADASLTRMKDFQQAGGRVMLVSPERSFLKNEMGVDRDHGEFNRPFATLPLSRVLRMTGDFDAALASVIPATPIGIDVTDQAGKKAYGVIIQQSRDPKSGEVFAILNNVSKDVRVVRLNERGQGGNRFWDMLTRRPIENEWTLEPCDVALIRRER